MIYILADDAGYADFGCYGQKDIKTPSIDKIANEGMIFTDHYAGAPVCAPSRSSLLTGQHTGHTYIRGNRELIPEGQLPLAPEVITIANLLKHKGYSTGIIGKWGLGSPGSTGEPNKKGFDHWFGYLCQRQAHNYYPDHLWKNGNRIDLDGSQYAHDMFTKEVLRWIKANKEKPFFLYLPYTIPHASLQVPDLGPYAEKNWNENKKKFAAMITRMDRDIGEINKLIKNLEIEKNTLIIISSDNGPHNEGGANPSYFKSSGPFRGMKRDLYEGGIRVPMIAWWPGRVKPGTRSNHVSAFWDILPTFVELAGAKLPDNIDGISMLPELTGKRSEQKKHKYLYWEFHEQGGKQAVRMDEWKAVRLNVRRHPDSPIELYNLKNDPAERNNMADSHPEIVAEMKGIMKNARSVSEEFPLIGKMSYRFGLFNAWLFSLVFLGIQFLLMILGRWKNKKEIFEIFAQYEIKGKIASAVSATLTIAMYAFTLFLPLWFGTWREDFGIIISVIGVIGYTIAQSQKLFRKPGKLLSKGIYSVFRNSKMIFTTIFWIGVGIVTASDIMFFMIILSFSLKHYIVFSEERVFLETYGDEYKVYTNRVSRYIPFF